MREIVLSSIVTGIIRMNLMQIVMSVIFALSAGYIIWCLYKATRYMREHPNDLRWPDAPTGKDRDMADNNPVNNNINL